MEKPTFEQFGINKEEYEKFIQWDKLLEETLAEKSMIYPLIVLVPGAIGAFFYIYLYSGENVKIIGTIIFLLIVTFIADFCIGFVITVGANLIIPPALYLISTTYRSYCRYKWKLYDYEKLAHKTSSDFWLSLKGRDFERELSNLFSKQGYQTSLTPYSNDQGVDIILHKDGAKIVVQCKAHKKPVGPAIMRELHGAMVHSNANMAFLACPSGVTAGAKDYIKDKPIRVIDLKAILVMQKNASDQLS